MLLGHVDDIALRVVVRHGRRERLRERLGLIPPDIAGLRHLERRYDMQALAACRLAKGDEAEWLEPVAKLLRRLRDRRERDTRPRVQIEHQPPRQIRFPGSAVPGMEFDCRALCHGDQALHVVDLEIGLVPAIDDRLADLIGQSPPGMALKPCFLIDAVRRAKDCARPPFQMRDHRRPDGLEIAAEIELGYRLDSIGGRP